MAGYDQKRQHRDEAEHGEKVAHDAGGDGVWQAEERERAELHSVLNAQPLPGSSMQPQSILLPSSSSSSPPAPVMLHALMLVLWAPDAIPESSCWPVEYSNTGYSAESTTPENQLQYDSWMPQSVPSCLHPYRVAAVARKRRRQLCGDHSLWDRKHERKHEDEPKAYHRTKAGDDLLAPEWASRNIEEDNADDGNQLQRLRLLAEAAATLPLAACRCAARILQQRRIALRIHPRRRNLRVSGDSKAVGTRGCVRPHAQIRRAERPNFSSSCGTVLSRRVCVNAFVLLAQASMLLHLLLPNLLAAADEMPEWLRENDPKGEAPRSGAEREHGEPNDASSECPAKQGPICSIRATQLGSL